MILNSRCCTFVIQSYITFINKHKIQDYEKVITSLSENNGDQH